MKRQEPPKLYLTSDQPVPDGYRPVGPCAPFFIGDRVWDFRVYQREDLITEEPMSPMDNLFGSRYAGLHEGTENQRSERKRDMPQDDWLDREETESLSDIVRLGLLSIPILVADSAKSALHRIKGRRLQL